MPGDPRGIHGPPGGWARGGWRAADDLVPIDGLRGRSSDEPPMHELAIMEDLVCAVARRAVDDRILAVRLEIGRLSGVDPDALRFCFDVCARGTPVDGSNLDIVEIDGRGLCRSCGREVPMTHVCSACPCGSLDVELLCGQELRIRELEVVARPHAEPARGE